MKRILFVDDEPKILMALRRSLRSYRKRWEMVFAEGGPAALEHFAAEPFDVIVSDARMPGMDGAQLLDNVSRLYPDTARMILSGQCSRASVLKCVAAAHQFFSKPCELETLTSALCRVCDMRGAMRNIAARTALSQVQRLPTQSGVYRELVEALDTHKPPMSRVAEIVTRDLAMMAKIVQLVSSGFFGNPRRISDVGEAANLLGPETMQAVFISSAAVEPDAASCRDGELQRLACHSRSVATAAKKIAKTLTDDEALISAAFLAGLLHEVGALVLDQPVHTGLSDNRGSTSVRQPRDLGDIEDLKRTGVPGPSGYLAALWGVPDSVIHAIDYHHAPCACPAGASVPLTALHVADALLEQNATSPNPNASVLALDYLRRNGCANQLPLWHRICDAACPE